MQKTRGKQKEAVFHVRVSIHAKRPLCLIHVIQFFVEPADFLLISANPIELHTAEDHAHRTAAQQQSDYKIQHSFITSLSCGESVRRNSPNVWNSPVKFGAVSSVSGIYPASPKSIGSLVITVPP